MLFSGIHQRGCETDSNVCRCPPAGNERGMDIVFFSSQPSLAAQSKLLVGYLEKLLLSAPLEFLVTGGG